MRAARGVGRAGCAGLVAGLAVALALPADGVARQSVTGTPGGGQSVADAVARTEEGVVRFAFRTRPDVEICEDGIRMGSDRWVGEGNWRSRGEGFPARCHDGPARVELDVEGGIVRDIEVLRGDHRANPRAQDVGEVSPDEAVAFLASVARTFGSGRGAREAVFPMVLADADEVWRPLMDLARDRELGGSVRKNALFWLGQEAAAVATEGLAEVARDATEDLEVRKAAVFALSQRPADEGVPLLMEVAQTAEDAETRRSAMFWLAQSNDPRVLPFFEKVLLGAPR